MEIILNNNKETIPGDNISVADLIRIRNFTFKLLVTKVNGQLVRKDDRDKVFIKEGDDVMVMHLISGG
ncbi:MAG TPA: sulfur carrier protein ThiS [Bacteroidales bacterium]|nr:sulfur carrier protein ThiS [Bacteroidales bacterium]HOX79288.1 sulfur carrier protein ThiS [Bacteroidales bacterium]HPI86382.1 sulfur carrier protein ThiS [Bacteroidales bacterium]